MLPSVRLCWSPNIGHIQSTLKGNSDRKDTPALRNVIVDFKIYYDEYGDSGAGSGDYDIDDIDDGDDDNDGDDMRDWRWGWEWCRAWERCQRMKMLKMRGWLLRSNYRTTADNCGQNGETVSHLGTVNHQNIARILNLSSYWDPNLANR